MPSLQELRSAAKAAGLSPYGNKDELESRLNQIAARELIGEDGAQNDSQAIPEDVDAQATTAVMQASASVTEASVTEESKPAPFIDKRLIIPTEEQIKALSYTDQHAKGATVTLEHARKVMEEMRSRYPQLNVKLNIDQEAYVFEGGIQGRVTTTIHQPVSALLHQVSGVAPSYIREHREGLAAKGSFNGATGDLLGRAAVYE